jgi:hypothetical protein
VREAGFGAGATGVCDRHSQSLPGRATTAFGVERLMPRVCGASARGTDGLADRQQQLAEGLALQHELDDRVAGQACAGSATVNIPASAAKATPRRFKR